MNKRTSVKIVSYLTAFVVAIGIFGLTNYNKAKYYKFQLELNYQQSLNELGEYVGNIETTLDKGLYAATDTMVSQLSSELWREASGAKSAMSKLPLKDLALENTYKFLSQVGDFAYSLNKKIASGGEITEEEHQSLVSLSEISKSINKSVSNLLSLYAGSESITDEANSLSININSEISGLGGSFADTEETLTNYPSLIYDGPFSDHLIDRQAEMTKNAQEVSRTVAQDTIKGLKEIPVGELNYTGIENSNMPCYNFGDKTTNYSVTQYGGYLATILNSRKIAAPTIGNEAAVVNAKNFLNANGFSNMESTYYANNDGICIINFAYMKDGITYYTDLIKVGVALDDGSIVSFDARGFLSNHKARQLEAPKFTITQCQQNISKYLTVLSIKEAVIPTKTDTEVYAYEFHCKSKSTGEELLVYINTKTGKESDILFMLYTDDGIFVK